MCPVRDIFTIIKKRLFFHSMLNFGAIPTVAIVEGEMSLHAGQAKKVIARTNNYSKRDSGKGS